VLLLFSRLLAKDPELLEVVLRTLSGHQTLSVGPSFLQQVKLTGKGVPDAVISQSGFLILIETKVDAAWNASQMSNHIENSSLVQKRNSQKRKCYFC
jgi:hypothetical protein